MQKRYPLHACTPCLKRFPQSSHTGRCNAPCTKYPLASIVGTRDHAVCHSWWPAFNFPNRPQAGSCGERCFQPLSSIFSSQYVLTNPLRLIPKEILSIFFSCCERDLILSTLVDAQGKHSARTRLESLVRNKFVCFSTTICILKKFLDGCPIPRSRLSHSLMSSKKKKISMHFGFMECS